ncbi:hypothetical protein M9194_02365 [Vibrio sp. S4M6]|uniref:hypothetical protein n=1 Tax=Vibrio sinus TaxID=2946865 RepID=UPI00202A8D92|nr:hypothetical protein [Vibrio sinus]MCL9780274.1 hypothetical protein [Vibrio sinus]
MSTFTIFFHGTGSNSTDLNNTDAYFQGELISTLASLAEGRLFFDYLEVDGVGSGKQDEWLKPTNNSYGNERLGRDKYLGNGIQSNMEYAKGIVTARQDFSKYGQEHYIVRAKRLLHDINDQAEVKSLAADLYHADKSRLALLQRHRWENPITTVNLIGWSRGGVSCFEFANYLYRDPKTRDININIFACDPVPGGRNKFKNYKHLNSNVRQIVCLFAEHERSTGFKARMPTLHGSTKSYVSFIPGRHATLVGNAHSDGAKSGLVIAKGPYFITRDFAEKALTGWGTRLRQVTSLTQSELMAIYNRIIANEDVYNNMGSSTYIPSLGSMSNKKKCRNAYNALRDTKNSMNPYDAHRKMMSKKSADITSRVKYDTKYHRPISAGKIDIDGLNNRSKFKPYISKHHKDTVEGHRYVLTGNPKFIDVDPFETKMDENINIQESYC